jgi:hypothetical protein
MEIFRFGRIGAVKDRINRTLLINVNRMTRLTSWGLTGQIIHGLPNLPMIDIVAVEELFVAFVKLFIGFLRVSSSDGLRANGSDRFPRYHRRGRC